MKKGHLSQYFEGVASKLLSHVETDPSVSNQHEFNGVSGLKYILGDGIGAQEYETTFIYLSDDETRIIREEGKLVWYDAREKARLERGINRSEHRLYYTSRDVMGMACQGDLLVIAKLRNRNKLLAIVAEANSTSYNQIAWLFNASSSLSLKYSIVSDLELDRYRIDLAASWILDSIGIERETMASQYCDLLIQRFPKGFPSTREFSFFARETLPDVDFKQDYDNALVTWMEREEELFKIYEKYLIKTRLDEGFIDDSDAFLSFALSVLNRRKSRAGLALENHLEFIFSESGIKYSRGAITENRSRPDFIFPGIEAYHDCLFNKALLTVLGVKSTCKDRWRQVLAEAERVEKKHLLTLEAGISKNQTDEMRDKKLQLVIPQPLQRTYLKEQQPQLISLVEFVEIILERQRIKDR